MHKHIFALATFSVALTVSPALAADATVVYTPAPSPTYSQPISAQSFAAHAEAGIGIISVDDDSEELYGLAGRVNVPLTSQVGVLVDVNVAGLFDVDDAVFTTATGHLWRRDGDVLYGVFGGAIFPAGSGAETITVVGLEGKYDFGQQIVGGQFSALFADGETAYAGKLELDHYFTPNLKAGINGQILWGGGFNETVWSFGGVVENRFEGLPVSAFVSGQATFVEDVTALTGIVGLRVFYDSPGSTLQSHDEAVPFDYGLISTFF